jgi:hypothetical protein
MKDVTVLMLGHKAQTGKDTFFSVAKDYGFVRAAFADKLKLTVMDLYNFSHDQMFGESKDIEDTRYTNTVDKEMILDEANWDPMEVDLALSNGVEMHEMMIPNPDYKPFFTPRRILQIFGQQQRLLFPDIWAAYVFNTTIPSLVKEGHDRIVITDFRFRNEAKIAKDWQNNNVNNKLRLIKINRDIEVKSGAGDISEHDLDEFTGWNYIVNNLTTLDTYKESVKYFLKDFFDSNL